MSDHGWSIDVRGAFHPGHEMVNIGGEERPRIVARPDGQDGSTETEEKTENESGLTVEPSAAVELGGLSHRQWLFVEAFLGPARGNATEAASMAGYTGNRNTLKSIGQENLRKPDISSRINARLNEVGVTTTALLHELAEVATAPMGYFMIVTKPAVYNERGEKISDVQMRLDYGAKVRAIELLMRYRRMLDDRPVDAPTVKVLVGVDLSRI